jgi:hypothetical protein
MVIKFYVDADWNNFAQNKVKCLPGYIFMAWRLIKSKYTLYLFTCVFLVPDYNLYNCAQGTLFALIRRQALYSARNYADQDVVLNVE